MKSLCLVTFLFLSFFYTTSSKSQEIIYGNASLSAPACIVLNESEPLAVYYKMSLTVLGFTNADEAKTWAGHYSNNLITLSTNFDLGEAYIQLHNERLGTPQSLSWWNNYLSDLCNYYIEN